MLWKEREKEGKFLKSRALHLSVSFSVCIRGNEHHARPLSFPSLPPSSWSVFAFSLRRVRSRRDFRSQERRRTSRREARQKEHCPHSNFSSALFHWPQKKRTRKTERHRPLSSSLHMYAETRLIDGEGAGEGEGLFCHSLAPPLRKCADACRHVDKI